MKTDLLTPFYNIPYFTIEGFKQVTGMDAPHTVRTLLSRWAKAGHILTLKKGVYMTRQFYTQHRQDHDFAAAVSAVLLPTSYVSLEYVLQEHNLLTEVTYPITCITLHNTRTVINTLGTFWYRSIRDDLYTGYTISEHMGIRFARASLAKALFDFLYLRPLPAPYRTTRYDLAEELRLNLDELDALNWAEFAAFVSTSASAKMQEILANFRRHGWLQ